MNAIGWALLWVVWLLGDVVTLGQAPTSAARVEVGVTAAHGRSDLVLPDPCDVFACDAAAP